jgi:hypothetical protein
VAVRLDVAAQVEFEAKLETGVSHLSFKVVLGAFNMDLIGSTCTALP